MEVSMNIQFLFGAVERVPEITPNRWNLISEIVQDCQNLTVSDECPKVYLGGGEKGKSFGRFCSSPKQCEDVYETLKNVGLQSKEITQSIETAISNSTTKALKPIILVPIVHQCCGNRIRIDPRPSFPLLYTRHGTFLAAVSWNL